VLSFDAHMYGVSATREQPSHPFGLQEILLLLSRADFMHWKSIVLRWHTNMRNFYFRISSLGTCHGTVQFPNSNSLFRDRILDMAKENLSRSHLWSN